MRSWSSDAGWCVRGPTAGSRSTRQVSETIATRGAFYRARPGIPREIPRSGGELGVKGSSNWQSPSFARDGRPTSAERPCPERCDHDEHRVQHDGDARIGCDRAAVCPLRGRLQNAAQRRSYQVTVGWADEDTHFRQGTIKHALQSVGGEGGGVAMVMEENGFRG